MNIVTFELCRVSQIDVYCCDEKGNQSGDYVSLAEYQELRQLLERIDKHPHLVDMLGYKESPELAQLLSDIKKTLK